MPKIEISHLFWFGWYCMFWHEEAQSAGLTKLVIYSSLVDIARFNIMNLPRLKKDFSGLENVVCGFWLAQMWLFKINTTECLKRFYHFYSGLVLFVFGMRKINYRFYLWYEKNEFLYKMLLEKFGKHFFFNKRNIKIGTLKNSFGPFKIGKSA